MNLKYYLRGLGLGIIVTALIMSIAGGLKKESLTNDEIKERALALGMIENKPLSEYEAEKDAEKQPEEPQIGETTQGEEEPEPAEVPQDEEEPQSEEIPQEEESAADTNNNAVTDTGKIAEKDISAEPSIFSIKSGDSSYGVAKRLESMGLIQSAVQFDEYLVKNGYDRKLVVSEHTIPADADMETIAKILTSRE